jgi:hypothetical protein
MHTRCGVHVGKFEPFINHSLIYCDRASDVTILFEISRRTGSLLTHFVTLVDLASVAFEIKGIRQQQCAPRIPTLK